MDFSSKISPSLHTNNNDTHGDWSYYLLGSTNKLIKSIQDEIQDYILFYWLSLPIERERDSYHRKCCSIIGISGWDKSLIFIVSEWSDRNLQGKLNNTHDVCLQNFSSYYYIIYKTNKSKKFQSTGCQILKFSVIL